jgi:septal ring factor EnvC (AmiA/AmiB activator)
VIEWLIFGICVGVFGVACLVAYVKSKLVLDLKAQLDLSNTFFQESRDEVKDLNEQLNNALARVDALCESLCMSEKHLEAMKYELLDANNECAILQAENEVLEAQFADALDAMTLVPLPEPTPPVVKKTKSKKQKN